MANDDPTEVAFLISEDHCAFGLSDAGAHVGQLCDAPQATDLLGNWVRDRAVMTIEQAVHRLTKSQADLFHLVDRGELRVGAWADIVVFDAKTISPGPLKRVYDMPAGADRLVSEASGIDAVIVNGRLIRQDNKDAVSANDKLPGRLLRHGRAA